MKREDFIQIIRLRSCWKIEKGLGDYFLPNGSSLFSYVFSLVEGQLQLDNLAILRNGDLSFFSGGCWNSDCKDFDDYLLHPDFGENEVCSYEFMEKRIEFLVNDIIYFN